MRATAILALLLFTACGGGAQEREGDSPDAAPDAPAFVQGGDCNAVVTHETPLEAASHVPQGSVVDWKSNPPSSGAHYPTHVEWATTFPVEVERGNYLHNEEHGGVVLIYNCPGGGCADVVSGLSAIGAALPQDPACASYGVNARWLVTPDHNLPDGIQVAAAAWGWTYKATCFDPVSLRAFIAARYAQGGSDKNNCTPQI